MPFSNIDKPSKYFDTKLYTGNGSTQTITGLNFSPDWVWIKDRTNGSANHNLFDVLRTWSGDSLPARLYSNTTDAEESTTYLGASNLTAFNSNGFTLGSGGNTNTNTNSYVAWCWDANGAGVSNTQGTITSTVSANTTSGFSIVSYTGNGTNGASVGHGLGVTPAFWIIKDRDNGTYNWVIGSKALSDPNNQRLLFTTGAVGTASGIFNPSSTTMTFTTSYGGTNESGEKFIMYCFAEVKGFSKAFSYTGNGSADGTFVYTGMRPAWVMIKYSSGANESWAIFDNKRNVYNPESLYLYANTSGSEGTETGGIDFLSNGFKIRNSYGYTNNSGGTYIGFAIAEQPFVSSKGIVANAR